MYETPNTAKYHFVVGDEVKHAGITRSLARSEEMLRRIYGAGRIVQIGSLTTRESALEWEDRMAERNFPTGALMAKAS